MASSRQQQKVYTNQSHRQTLLLFATLTKVTEIGITVFTITNLTTIIIIVITVSAVRILILVILTKRIRCKWIVMLYRRLCKMHSM